MRGLVLLILLVLCSLSFADTVVFQDNFDSHADWQSPEQNYSSGSDDSEQDGDHDTPCTSCPQDGAVYSGLYSARASWSDYRGNRTMNIDNTNYRGASGKGLTFYMEPVNSSSCDGGSYW